MFTSSGIIITNPQSKSTALGQWWIIVDVCPELGRYYYEMTKWANRAKQDFQLQVPSWGYHVSVLRGETITAPEALNTYAKINGTPVEFSYKHEVLSNGRYYWVPIESVALLDLRETLGVPRNPQYSLHLTIGVNPLVKGL